MYIQYTYIHTDRHTYIHIIRCYRDIYIYGYHKMLVDMNICKQMLIDINT